MNNEMKKLSDKFQQLQMNRTNDATIILLDYVRLSVNMHEQAEQELATSRSDDRSKLLDNLVYMQWLGKLIIEEARR